VLTDINTKFRCIVTNHVSITIVELNPVIVDVSMMGQLSSKAFLAEDYSA
jgi:hypothetical protein